MKTRQTQLLRTVKESVYQTIAKYYDRILEIQNKDLHPDKTAITRKSATVPLKNAMKKITLNGIGLDLGCGKSLDADILEKAGIKCFRYDPYFCPLGISLKDDSMESRFDFVILAYTLNVVPLEDRKLIAKCAVEIVKNGGTIIVGLRDDKESIKDTWEPFSDGWITPRKTFQTFYKKQDLTRVQALFPNCIVEYAGRSTWIIKKQSEEA